MSASQFDDLLGDFGNSTSSSSVKATANGNVDEFDPFGPSGAEQTTNGGDSGLLVDFSIDTEVRNGDSSNGLDFDFHGTSSETGSANPLYDMSTNGAQSSNPLYDLSSSNPLYDFSMEDSNQSANPLYDMGTDIAGSPQPSNPLYDLEGDSSGQDFDGTNEEQEQYSEDHGEQFEEQRHEENTFLQASVPDVVQEEVTVITQDDASENVDQGEQIELEDSRNVEQDQYDQFETEQIEQEQVDQVETEQEVPLEQEQVDQVETEQEVPLEQEQVDQVETEQNEDIEQDQTEQQDEVAQGDDSGHNEQFVAEELHEPSLIPSVEITQSPDNEDMQQAELAGHEEHSVSEEHDYYEATGGEDSSSAIGYHDKLTPPENYGHDRREEDLENYCMDREESDLMEEQDSSETQCSLKPREERSRSPSRSIGPDLQEESDVSEELDTLRPRGDRSHAPSRSLEPEVRHENTAEEEEIIQDGRTISKTTRTENRYSDSGYTQSNQWEEQRNEQNVEQDRQTEQDVIHFTEMSSVKNKFESQAPPAEHKRVDIRQEVMSSEGGVYESQPQSFQQWQNEEEEEEGVYESTPAPRPDIAREADKDLAADLPPVGTAQSIRAKFLASTSQDNTPKKREVTPPAHGSGGEYVSEPRGYIEKYEGKADAGVFESQPVANPDVVTSTTALEDPKPEHGFAKNVAAKFKELENKKGTYTPTNKRELTPDRSGRIEYVSEPRGQFERYEGRAESGVFESQPAVNPDVIRSGEEVREELPERGTAKNIAQKFRQISSEPATSTSRGKRELTPDKSGRVEYVSEPRSQMEMYEVKVDSGVFENQPQRNPDVVTSETSNEEYLPERGYAKNVAAKFKSLESNAKSPPLSPGRHKEFTPPREEERARQAVVLENTPDFKTEIIHSGDQLEEKLPERGTAKNIAQRFKQLESESKSPSAPRQKKEFTPPPHDAGVYENQPKQFHADYNRPAESGILENTPIVRDDVIKATEPRRYEEELPERGSARNMVNKWKQLETAKSPGSTGRPKEFTPPREEPRIAQQRNPKSPRTPLSPSGYDQLDNGSVHPRDLPGQYQPLNEPTVFESTPEVREGVLKESDTDWTEGMPKKDQAKKMLAKFQHIQEEAKKQSPVPVSRKDSTYSEGSETESDHTMENDNVKNDIGDKVGRSKSMRAAIQTEKCGACDKTVYAMERLEMNKRVYHKACFRCTQCKAVLTPKTFAINNEVIFCTNHYKQLFATKGNYDEGFGRVQHKKRWSSNPNLHEREGEEDGKHTVKS
uniref:LIM zinc-binding domain-containing protein n=1 Tax=Biomphalaria glabrata TaxID=6526 RepID=A0A2C9JL33_BIOGL